MIEVARVECLDKRDSERVEREYIESLGASLNKMIPTRTKKEYREDTKDRISAKGKEYYAEKKEELKEKSSKYYYDNTEAVKIRKKKYSDSHKEENRLYMIEYRAKKKAEKLEAGSI